MEVKPYDDEGNGKKIQVRQMFNNIAPRYDFLNRFLSLGIDILWRKKAISLLKRRSPKRILDIATGTADLAFEALALHPDKITGIDISENMLDVGRNKIRNRGLDSRIELMQADSENLPFEDESFDAVTVAFGVRNFENLDKGLTEMRRVLKENGMAVILEFSKPSAFPFKQMYRLYFSFVLPFVGKSLSRDARAYDYLPRSVAAFPEGKEFMDILQKNGFKNISCKRVTGGIASIYSCTK
jgi:demethylmenaquinone methyltransferase/2-methoxy-6-polyprenyl-1,4-benzoquinol methylase